MSKFSRALQYATAKAGLAAFNKRTLERRSNSLSLFSELQSFAHGYFLPIQMVEEFTALLDMVRAIEPRFLLEIGTHWGGTLHCWTRVSRDDATLISVDLPGGKFGGGYSEVRVPLYQSFALPEQNLNLLRLDSHLSSTFEEVKKLLGEHQLDFAFIDGDHSYEGVKMDFEMYSPLVRSGGLVAFHDIASNYDDTQVCRFWEEVKSDFKHWEFVYHPDKIYGIGVLQMS